MWYKQFSQLNMLLLSKLWSQLLLTSALVYRKNSIFQARHQSSTYMEITINYVFFFTSPCCKIEPKTIWMANKLATKQPPPPPPPTTSLGTINYVTLYSSLQVYDGHILKTYPKFTTIYEIIIFKNIQQHYLLGSQSGLLHHCWCQMSAHGF